MQTHKPQEENLRIQLVEIEKLQSENDKSQAKLDKLDEAAQALSKELQKENTKKQAYQKQSERLEVSLECR